ncbi:PREDICTED: soma ferritin-like [Priapulus caudatus]|uniref:Ferritin n=1 Tax=Priapulus caudatus TaxID=37621 RepID=A0ABM1DUX4_PRICU|nr:PREDICTED: soma ferritin-like [Priapulus caudatus]
MAVSQVRQNFHQECEAAINKQINMELYASYIYSSMAWYFDRDDVALPGFHKFFNAASVEETEHATELMRYQNRRGGRIVLQDIQKPMKDEWGSGVEAMQTALDIEKNVNDALLKLHALAEKHFDAHLDDFIEEKYLEEQVESIKKLADFVTKLKRAGPGLGEYMFDKEELQEAATLSGH